MKLFFCIVGIFVPAIVVSGQSPRVTVAEGTLVGKTVLFSENKFINVTKNVDLFLGVPYARPPMRFAPPEPMTPWQGDRNATEFSSSCQQTPYLIYTYGTLSEDCLYLNVYAPSPKPSGASVMVWIHGGGFTEGSAMVYDYSGIPLVAVGDVIVVTFNYRLTVFAQFSTEDDESPGNYGMLDQVAALEWVYNNIEAFGGNRNQITIFGESAGSASVSYHVLSELSRGYFNQAILQSGTAFSPWAFRDDPSYEIEKAQELGRKMGCEDVMSTSALVACLREVEDPFVLGAAADEVYGASFPVTLDGRFLKDTPTNLYQMGKFANVSMMIGFNRDEGTLYPYFYYQDYVGSPTPPPINRTTFEAIIKGTMGFYGRNDDIVLDAVFQEYIDWTIADDPQGDYFQSWVDFGTDTDFACPSDMVMRRHVAAGGTVYKYFMTHAPSKSLFQAGDLVPTTPWIGAGHAEDLTFVFGHPFIEENYNIRGHNMTDEENALSVQIMRFWTNFAKTGDPSKSSLGGEQGEREESWPLYTIPELKHKELSLDLGEGRALKARQCHFWNEYIPGLETFSNSIGDDEKEWRESYGNWKEDMTEWQHAFDEYKQQPTCN